MHISSAKLLLAQLFFVCNRSCPLIHTYRLGEDLQQDALVVSVGEEAELLQLAELVLGQRVLADASCESREGGKEGGGALC